MEGTAQKFFNTSKNTLNVAGKKLVHVAAKARDELTLFAVKDGEKFCRCRRCLFARR